MADSTLQQLLSLCVDPSSNESPLDALLKAPEQKWLEERLGFSLDPALHARRAAEKQERAADAARAAADAAPPAVDAAGPAEDTLTEAEIQQLLAAGAASQVCPPAEAEDVKGLAEAVAPALDGPAHAEAEPMPEAPTVAVDEACATPEKVPSKPNPVIEISPGTPVETELHDSFLEILFIRIDASANNSFTKEAVARKPAVRRAAPSGLAAQLANMDPKAIEKLLSVVNMKLQSSRISALVDSLLHAHMLACVCVCRA